MRFKKLVANGKAVPQHMIERSLEDQGFAWLVDCELEDADVEIVRNTLIWKSGNFYTGSWRYGIWKSGDFHGRWENGIFESGRMLGEFVSGIMDPGLSE
jgi:hypothetical protein